MLMYTITAGDWDAVSGEVVLTATADVAADVTGPGGNSTCATGVTGAASQRGVHMHARMCPATCTLEGVYWRGGWARPKPSQPATGPVTAASAAATASMTAPAVAAAAVTAPYGGIKIIRSKDLTAAAAGTAATALHPSPAPQVSSGWASSSADCSKNTGRAMPCATATVPANVTQPTPGAVTPRRASDAGAHGFACNSAHQAGGRASGSGSFGGEAPGHVPWHSGMVWPEAPQGMVILHLLYAKPEASQPLAVSDI